MSDDSFAKMILLIFVVVGLIGLTAMTWTNAEDTRRTLQAAGFTNIEVGGHAWFACGGDDEYSTEFTARNSRGEMVSGVVCCGFFKNCTVRF